jgi:geranylgeranyl pyrophosphate synthase
MNTLKALDTEFSPLVTLLDALSREPVHGQVPRALWEDALYRPLLDFTAHPGKELRSKLTRIAHALAGGRGEAPVLLPLLCELLHAGSLIVDDIEDDSAERRGRPTLHRAHGLPLALNAGNFLYFVPFTLLAQLPVSARTQLAMHRQMAETLVDCHRGQALDLHARVDELEQSELPAVVAKITELKTGKLLGMATGLGALCAEASDDKVAALVRFGEAFGVALQMLDDLGGLTQEARADKGLEDLRLRRATWVWAWLSGLTSESELRALQRSCRRAARDEVAARELRAQLRKLVEHDGRSAVRRNLREALDTLSEAIGPHALIQELERHAAGLERSYA